MNCPVCAPTALLPITLEPNLFAHQCSQCDGLLISATQYWTWRNVHGPDLEERPDENPPALEPYQSRPRRCPHCRHLMLPFKVFAGHPLTLDHCGHCNAIWFQRNAWQTLQRRQLHDHIHQIFGEPWQRRLRQAEQRARQATIYRNLFGEADYAELQRIKAWLDSHPQSQAMRAYLNNEHEEH